MKEETTKGHFLNKEQKEAKQEIIENCLSELFRTMADHLSCFNNDAQLLSDLFGSVLITLLREILVTYFSLIHDSGENKRNEIIEMIFDEVKKEVSRKLKELGNMESSIKH